MTTVHPDLPGVPRTPDGGVGPSATVAEPVVEGGLGRFGLAVALVLTVTAIGAGTWALGSGSDEDRPDGLTPPAVGSAGPGQAARPPLAVAPPPDADSRRADRSERAERTTLPDRRQERDR